MSARAVFLDRDGVVNELVAPSYDRGPRLVQELRLKPGIVDLVSKLVELDFVCVVITNQPDVSRGHLSLEDLEAVNEQIMEMVPGISRIYTCTHDNHHKCLCRKPMPGLVADAIADFGILASESFFLGDRWTDVLAAKRSGVTSVLLSNSQANEAGSQGSKPSDLEPDFEIDTVLDLLQIVS